VFAIQFKPILNDIARVTSTEYIYKLDLQNRAQNTGSDIRIVYFGQYWTAKNGVFITEYCHLHLPLKLDASASFTAIGEDPPKISVSSRTRTLKAHGAKKKSVRLMSPLCSRESFAEVGDAIIYRCPRVTEDRSHEISAIRKQLRHAENPSEVELSNLTDWPAICNRTSHVRDVRLADKLLCFDGQSPQSSDQSTSISTTDGPVVHPFGCGTFARFDSARLAWNGELLYENRRDISLHFRGSIRRFLARRGGKVLRARHGNVLRDTSVRCRSSVASNFVAACDSCDARIRVIFRN